MANQEIQSLLSLVNINLANLTTVVNQKLTVYGENTIDIDTIDTNRIDVGHTPNNIYSSIGLPNEFQRNTYVAVITLVYMWRMQIICSMYNKVIAYRVYNAGTWHNWSIIYNESPMYVKKDYTYEYSCPASGAINITGANLGVSTPAGYRPISVLSYITNSNEVIPRSMIADSTGSASFCVLTNKSANAVTATLQISILYAKDN